MSKKKVLNILDTIVMAVLYLFFIILWCKIAEIGFCFIVVSWERHFAGGILILLYIIMGITVFVSPAFFKSKLTKARCLIPLLMIALSVTFCLLVAGIHYGIEKTIMDFTPQCWSENKEIREYMIDDLESEYSIKGMTDTEIKELLGEPDSVMTLSSDSSAKCFGYYIGMGYIDPVFYEIYFDDNIAINSQKAPH